jgi:nucleoside-diphosphate-sugar epimerase
MSKIMVTGGSGYIGSNLVEMMAMRGDDPLIFDVITPFGVRKALLEHVMDKVTFVRGNFLDLATMISTIKKNEVDKVVHLARYVTTQFPREPSTAKQDIEGMLNMLEAVRLTEVKRIVFMSSQTVYGPEQYSPMEEDHPKLPGTHYAVYKLASEHFGRIYSELYGIDFLALRPGNIYGLGMVPLQVPRRLINNIVQSAVKGVPVMRRSPQGRERPRVDHVYVKDLCNAVLLALDVKKQQLHHRIFNISTGEVVPISEVIKIVKELLPEAVIDIDVSDQQTTKGPYSIERARKELGYKPKYNIRAGLTDYIESCRKHIEALKIEG